MGWWKLFRLSLPKKQILKFLYVYSDISYICYCVYILLLMGFDRRLDVFWVVWSARMCDLLKWIPKRRHQDSFSIFWAFFQYDYPICYPIILFVILLSYLLCYYSCFPLFVISMENQEWELVFFDHWAELWKKCHQLERW